MAINFNIRYPDNTDVDSNYLVGKARNESFDGAKDYFPLEATWVNDILGFFSALLDRASLTPNGLPETKTNSQYWAAINSLSISMSRLTDGTSQELLGTLSFGYPDLGTGLLSITGQSGGGGYIKSQAVVTKSNVNEVRVQNGGFYYGQNTGSAHTVTSVLRPIAGGSVLNVTLSYGPAISVDPVIFGGINFGLVYRADLIMFNSSKYAVLPLHAQFENDSGTLKMSFGRATNNGAVPYDVASFTSYFLRIDVDPALIS